jgi:hypothetical protein
MIDDVASVRLRTSRLEEHEMDVFGDELAALATQIGKVVMILGPEPPDCLYSLFIAKLITCQRMARKAGGDFVLCDLHPLTFSVFQACALDRSFIFRDTHDQALAYFLPVPFVRSASS